MLHNNISTAEWVNRFSMKCIAGQKNVTVLAFMLELSAFPQVTLIMWVITNWPIIRDRALQNVLSLTDLCVT
jgi:hypothetical protein